MRTGPILIAAFVVLAPNMALTQSTGSVFGNCSGNSVSGEFNTQQNNCYGPQPFQMTPGLMNYIAGQLKAKRISNLDVATMGGNPRSVSMAQTLTAYLNKAGIKASFHSQIGSMYGIYKPVQLVIGKPDGGPSPVMPTGNLLVIDADILPQH